MNSLGVAASFLAPGDSFVHSCCLVLVIRRFHSLGNDLLYLDLLSHVMSCHVMSCHVMSCHRQTTGTALKAISVSQAIKANVKATDDYKTVTSCREGYMSGGRHK